MIGRQVLYIYTWGYGRLIMNYDSEFGENSMKMAGIWLAYIYSSELNLREVITRKALVDPVLRKLGEETKESVRYLYVMYDRITDF
jgi:hypothetical protein